MGDKLFFNQNYGITWDWARDQQTAWATSKPYDVVDIFRKEIHLIQAALYVGRNDSCHHLSCGRPKKKACNPLILDIENGRFRRQERTHLARRLRPVKMALLGRSIFSPLQQISILQAEHQPRRQVSKKRSSLIKRILFHSKYPYEAIESVIHSWII